MIGILCEKPSAAKNYANALGGMMGTFNGENYVICNAVGHIFEYVEPHEMVSKGLSTKYKEWSFDNLPWIYSDLSFKRRVCKDKENVASTIANTFSKCSEIAVATDLDPTGEGGLLAYEILEGCNLLNKKITRVKHLSETQKDICNAFKARETIDLGNWEEFLMSEFRSKVDFLTMPWTRAIACVCGELSREGRFKSSSRQLIGDQWQAYNSYVKKVTYQARFVDENKNVFINKEEPIYEDKSQVDLSVYSNSPINIVKTVEKRKVPDKLFDFGTLSTVMGRQGFSPEVFKKSYQDLYDNSYASYPRTEDQFITFEQFNVLLPLVDQIADLVGVDKSLLTVRTPRSTHVRNGGSHGANRPGEKVPSSLAEIKNRFGDCALAIYKALCYNYLAMLADDYKYNEITAEVVNYPKFISVIRCCTDLGYKKIYSINLDDEDAEIDNKSFGTTATPFIGEIVSPRPQAPTLTWLISSSGVLAKYGIGTPATRVQTIIEMQKGTAKAPASIKIVGGKIYLTEIGELSYKAMKGTWLANIFTSKELFEQMKQVSKNQINADMILNDIENKFMSDKDIIINNLGGIKKVNTPSKVHLTFNGLEGDVWLNKNGHIFTDAEIATMLNGGKVLVTDMVKKDGSKMSDVNCYLGLDTYNNKNELGILLEFVGEKSNNNMFYKVMFQGKEVEVYRKIAGYDLTDEQLEYLASGNKLYCDKLKKKTGELFTANLYMGYNEFFKKIGVCIAFN